MSGAPSDVKSGLSFALVTWTASVQFSKSAAGPRQHSIYLSVFITPGERVAQIYPQALGSSGTLGVPFPVPTIVGPWGLKIEFLLSNIYKFSPYLTGNTLHLHCKAHPVNAVLGNKRCLLWEAYGTHKYTVWEKCRVLVCQSRWYIY
jgi:hypothetical protein